MGICSRSSACAANLPSVTITSGFTEASCPLRNGSQAASSSGSGLRLFGGLHLTVLQM